MPIFTSGQVTITDLNDAPVLNAYITASRPTTQVYNSETAVWDPTYATTAQVLTLNLTKAGSNTSILADVDNAGVVWKRIDGTTNTTITSTTTSDAQYKSGTKNSILTTKTNVPANVPDSIFEASGVWVDPKTGLSVPFSATITISRSVLAKSAVLAHIYAPNGDTFRNDQPADLPINCDLYINGTKSSANKSVKWFKMDTSVTGTGSAGYDVDGGLGWALINTTAVSNSNIYANVLPNVTNHTAQGVLTVHANNVINALTVKCVMKDTASNVSATGYFTVRDIDDPVMTIIHSSNGDVFKNGTGASTTLTAKLYQNGEEVDTAGTAYVYSWKKYDKNGSLVSNFGGTNISTKNGKSISVAPTDVDTKATFIVEVSN